MQRTHIILKNSIQVISIKVKNKNVNYSFYLFLIF